MNETILEDSVKFFLMIVFYVLAFGAWNYLAPTYFSFLPTVWHSISFFEYLCLIIVGELVKSLSPFRTGSS